MLARPAVTIAPHRAALALAALALWPALHVLVGPEVPLRLRLRTDAAVTGGSVRWTSHGPGGGGERRLTPADVVQRAPRDVTVDVVPLDGAALWLAEITSPCGPPFARDALAAPAPWRNDLDFAWPWTRDYPALHPLVWPGGEATPARYAARLCSPAAVVLDHGSARGTVRLRVSAGDRVLAERDVGLEGRAGFRPEAVGWFEPTAAVELALPIPHRARAVEVTLAGPGEVRLDAASWVPPRGAWEATAADVARDAGGVRLRFADVQPVPFWRPQAADAALLVALWLAAWAALEAWGGDTGAGRRLRAQLGWARWAAPLAAVWLVWWLAFFPGVVSYDSLDQWRQILAGKYQNWHPALHTWTLWLLTRVGHSFASVSLVQVALTAALLGRLLAVARRLGAPRWLVWAAAGWLALSPLFGRGVIAVWKDDAFALAVLWTVLLLLESVVAGALPPALGTRLGVGLALVWLLRHNGPTVALPTLALAGWYHWRRSRAGVRRAAAVCLAAVVAVGASYRIAHVGRASPVLQQHYLIHQVAGLVAAGTPLSDADAATLETLLPLDAWRAAYTCRSANVLLWSSGLRDRPLRDRRLLLVPVWARLAARNPGALFAHWRCVSRYLWDPTAELHFGPLPIHADLGMVDPNPHGVAVASRLPAAQRRLAEVVNATTVPGSWARLVFWQPAVALYVLVAALAVALARARTAAPLVVFLPALANTLGVLALSSSPELRFQWPVALLAPVAVCLAGADWRRVTPRPPRRVPRPGGSG